MVSIPAVRSKGFKGNTQHVKKDCDQQKNPTLAKPEVGSISPHLGQQHQRRQLGTNIN